MAAVMECIEWKKYFINQGGKITTWFTSKTQHSSLKPCTLLLTLQNEVRVFLSSYLHFLLVLKISCVILYFDPPVQNNVAFLLQMALYGVFHMSIGQG